MSCLKKNVKQIIKKFLFSTSANFSRGLSQCIDFIGLFFVAMWQPKSPPPSWAPGTSGHVLIYEYTTSLATGLKIKSLKFWLRSLRAREKMSLAFFSRHNVEIYKNAKKYTIQKFFHQSQTKTQFYNIVSSNLFGNDPP